MVIRFVININPEYRPYLPYSSKVMKWQDYVEHREFYDDLDKCNTKEEFDKNYKKHFPEE